MAEHESIRNDLPLYVAGDLTPAEVARLEEHLAGCAACRREVREARAALDLLRRAGEEEGAAVALDDFFDERIAPHVERRRWWEAKLLRVAALVLAFVTGMVVDRIVFAEQPAAAPPAARARKPLAERLGDVPPQSTGLARTLHALAELRR